MKGHAPLMSKASDEWATPQEFFDVVNRFFNFQLDAAATRENAKAPAFITPEEDALSQLWLCGPVWLNPPYSRIAAFMDKAVEQAAAGHDIACLVPARTDTQWWHRATASAHEVRLLKGRLKFGDGANCAPFPSALIVYYRSPRVSAEPRIYNWDWRDR